MFDLLKHFRRDLVDQAEIAWLNSLNTHTPDIAHLESFKTIRLFVPDDMKRDLKRHDLLGETVYEAQAFTMDNFFFWKKNLREESFTIPILTQQPQGLPKTMHFPSPGKILGECHRIKPAQLIDLDRRRENGVQFIRKRVRLLVPNRMVHTTGYHKYQQPHDDPALNKPVITTSERVDILKAWMYVGKSEYWDTLIDAGYSYTSVSQYHAKQRKWLGYYFNYKDNE
jgi:hypothetical protein